MTGAISQTDRLHGVEGGRGVVSGDIWVMPQLGRNGREWLGGKTPSREGSENAITPLDANESGT